MVLGRGSLSPSNWDVKSINWVKQGKDRRGFVFLFVVLLCMRGSFPLRASKLGTDRWRAHHLFRSSHSQQSFSSSPAGRVGVAPRARLHSDQHSNDGGRGGAERQQDLHANCGDPAHYDFAAALLFAVELLAKVVNG